ncbi:unnamed protein product, partial [Mesorhabditis spiculigera]
MKRYNLSALILVFACYLPLIFTAENSTVPHLENSNFYLNLTTTVLDNRRKIPNIEKDYFEDTQGLNCIYGIQGTFDGEALEVPEQYKECDDQTKYCQKISAHYVSVAEITKITMRGCDRMTIEENSQIPYHPIRCKKAGCSEYKSEFDHEIYHVCCCNTDFCNGVEPIH